MSTQQYPRTMYEARLDVDYAIRLAHLHERLFSRLDGTTNALLLIMGTAAASAAFAPFASATVGVGLAVAALSIVSVLGKWSARAEMHKQHRKALIELAARYVGADDDALPELDASRIRLAAEAPEEIEALRRPAFNDNLRRHGRSEHVAPLGFIEKLAAAIA